MLKLWVIDELHSAWCRPIVLVVKEDGSILFCVDYHKVNEVSRFDAYPMPRVDEPLDELGTAHFFTTLDLISGYWQIPLSAVQGKNGLLHSLQFVPIRYTFVRLVRGPCHLLAFHGPGAAAICCRLPRWCNHLQWHVGGACVVGGCDPGVSEAGRAHGQPQEVCSWTYSIWGTTWGAQAGRLLLPVCVEDLTNPLTDFTRKGAPDLVQWTKQCQCGVCAGKMDSLWGAAAVHA